MISRRKEIPIPALFYVDGTPVDLTMTQKGNELEGMADAGGMQIPVKFKKTKK